MRPSKIVSSALALSIVVAASTASAQSPGSTLPPPDAIPTINPPKNPLKARWIRDVVDYLGKRFETLYAGAQQVYPELNSQPVVRGMIGVRGALIDLSDWDSASTHLLPFQLELQQDGRKRISVGILTGTPGDWMENGVLAKINFFEVIYDDRVPNRIERYIDLMSADVMLKTVELKSGWIGPRVFLGINSINNSYTFAPNTFAQNPDLIEGVASASTGVGFKSAAGIVVDKRFLNYAVNAYVGYQIVRSGSPNPASQSIQADAFQSGRRSYVEGKLASSQGLIELNISREVGKKGHQAGLFYQGSFARKAELNNVQMGPYDITNLELGVPHRVGIRLDLNRK